MKEKIMLVVRRAWKSFKNRYFINVFVVFLVTVIVGGYSFTTATDSSIPNIKSFGNSNAGMIEDIIRTQKLVNVEFPGVESLGGNYTKGVISVLVNQVSESGSPAFGILNGINVLIFKGRVAQSVVIFSMVLLTILVLIFVRNIFIVGQCRYFLEHRQYKETSAGTLLFVYRYGRTRNVAKCMFMRSLFQTLWNLTIVGGFIKNYEYSMIPYILAENPDIEWREAFRLSKELTSGDKRRIFIVDLIFAVGYIIQSFTYNILAVFLLDPFRASIFSEAYMQLRDDKKEALSKGELLNDCSLTLEGDHDYPYPEDVFGQTIFEKRKWMKIDYRKDYTFLTYVLFFFSFSLVGYVWEIFYTLLTEGVLANRGTMTGPWLPIYGVGGLVIFIFLKPLREHPLILFLATMLACGTVEYLTSWYLEFAYGEKWWDYTGFFLNINSRVCLEGLIVFGFAGVVFTYIFGPLLDNLYSGIPLKARKIAACVLVILFAVDFIWSWNHPNKGKGITDFGQDGMGKTYVVSKEASET